MAKVRLLPEKCKGCFLCVAVCPQKALVPGKKLNQKGYLIVEYLKEKNCSGCGLCYTVCPDVAIEIEE